MSLGEFLACLDGITAAHGGAKTAAPSGEEHLAMVERARARRAAQQPQ